MEAIKTAYPNLASERFSHGKKHYYFDVKRAQNNSHFLLITSSEEYEASKFRRNTIQLWEEDLAFFAEALSMVLSQLAFGQLPVSNPAMSAVKSNKGIKAIAEYDRPREKLHALGAAALSNAELLAVLLGTGSSELSVLDLCRKVMKSVKNQPAGLLNRTAADLCRFPGIGVAKAATILASLEFGRRAFSDGVHQH